MTRRTIIALAVLFALMLAASTLLSSPQRKPVALAPVAAQNHYEAADFLHEQRVEAANTTTTTVAQRATRSYNRFAGSRVEVGTHETRAKTTTVVASGNSDAKMFIYMHESGNNPASVNRGGCVGLGQNCPDRHGNVAVVAACPNWRTDYACQDNWFTNSYMVPRYGTWEKAKAFWLRGSWW